MADKRYLGRRNFLKSMLAAGLAPAFVPASAFGANDRIAIGYIGVGRRAQQLMKLPADAAVVALSDVYTKRMRDVQRRRENFQDCALYQDYREMLARSDIDGVIIASPDHWHALHAIHAMESGKDVYVEKPLTLTVREGRLMADTARKLGRICQTGSQQRSMDVNRRACEWVRNGRLGEIHRVHGANYPSPWECTLGAEDPPPDLDWDMWCGPTALRPFHRELYQSRVRGHEAGWISYRPYSGGEMTGWGAHGIDQIQWALGMDETGPVEFEPLLDQVPPDDGIHQGPRCAVRFRYANGIEVILDGEGPDGGGRFEGAAGTLTIDRAKFEASPGLDTSPVEDSGVHLYDSAEKTFTQGGDTEQHMGNWLYCMRSRELPVADVEAGHRATTICHLANIARWTGRKLHWDPETETILDDPEASSHLDRKRREPWIL